MSDCHSITSEGLVHITNIVYIKTLDISNCELIESKGLEYSNIYLHSSNTNVEYLSSFSDLQHLNLGHCKVSISFISSSIRSLDLQFCKEISLPGFALLSNLAFNLFIKTKRYQYKTLQCSNS